MSGHSATAWRRVDSTHFRGLRRLSQISERQTILAKAVGALAKALRRTSRAAGRSCLSLNIQGLDASLARAIRSLYDWRQGRKKANEPGPS